MSGNIYFILDVLKSFTISHLQVESCQDVPGSKEGSCPAKEGILSEAVSCTGGIDCCPFCL